ncbi:right-handed parallel beta-helix repeat-containing protein [Bacillus pumilus]|uniref:right-handed parallel beta-helix repeat-containing protein n=1 Tax=Bacillus pumilus TaxID=1408 RepID=UPI003454C328
MALEKDLIPVNTMGVKDEETGEWIPLDAAALRSHTDRLTIEEIRSQFSDILEEINKLDKDLGDRIVATAASLSSKIDSVSKLIGDISKIKADGQNLVEKLLNVLNDIRINVKDFGAIGDGKADDSKAINDVFKLASSKGFLYVHFPPGTYKVNESVRPFSNTYITGYGATIGRYSQHSNTLLSLVHPGVVATGYNGIKNVTIEGLTFEGNAHLYTGSFTGLTAAHANGLHILKCTFKNVRDWHFIDLPGSKDIVIEKCKFLGMEAKEDRYYTEAIQLDCAIKTAYGSSETVPAQNYDGTTTRDVTVDGCYFGASENMPAPKAGIGAHSAVTGKFYINITVKNSVFEGLDYYGVKPMKWRWSKVHKNHFINCHGGVYVAPIPDEALYDLSGTTRTPDTGRDILVEGNTFTGMREKAIYVLGREDAYFQDVELTDNIVTSTDDEKKGVYLRYADGVTINGHRSKGTGSQAIYAEFSRNVTINGGDIRGTTTDGIKFSSCDDVSVDDIRIRETGTHGIMTEGNCTNVEVNNVKVINPSQSEQGRYDGIYISNDTKDVLLSFNRIRSTKKRPRRGIWVTDTCSNVIADGNDTRCRSIESDSFRNSATGAVERVANL